MFLGMMTMKKIICPTVCLILLLITLLTWDKTTTILANLITENTSLLIPKSSQYKKEQDFLFVKNTNDFTPLSKGDLKNIFYTIVNNGWQDFTFYCPKEYTSCLEDVKDFSKDQDLLTHLNNFVHPYNSFSNVKTTISENGEINIFIQYIYTKEEQEQINNKIDTLYSSLITTDMTTFEDKILAIHDYIINNTKYDIVRNDTNDSNYHSYIAYGPLFEGYATCNGYTDAMALFLEKMNIPNFKVAMTPNDDTTEGHVWNAVYLNGRWLHLDLTWDDPVSNDGKDYLQHKYFLITTNQLNEVDAGEVAVTEHNFKENIYRELKKEN